jgi:drug/metabolite transporter (DMT)-like permease
MKNKKWAGWGILLLLSLIWGSSFILMKKALVVYSPEQVATLRIGLSALLFFPIFLRNLNKIRPSLLPYILVVALTGSGLPAFLFAFAQTEISSSLAGILNALTPLFTFLMGLLLFGQLFRWKAFTGVIIGLGGAILLVYMSGQSPIEGNMWYALLAVFAALCYGISSNTVYQYLTALSSFTINSTIFSLLGPFVIAYLFTTDFIEVLSHEEGAWEALGYVAILSWIGTFAATVLFFQLVKWTNALFGSTVAYLIPIVALGWGFIDGEQLSWFHFVGLGLIVGGVYAIRRGKN